MAVDAATRRFPKHKRKPAERGADAALTARAMVAVTFTGAGFWYLLVEIGPYLVAGR